jgi:hypothetical protein
MYEIFINLTCINRKLVYSEHKGWPQNILKCKRQSFKNNPISAQLSVFRHLQGLLDIFII